VIWIFVFGLFITVLVAAACGLVIAGLVAADRDLKRYEDDKPADVG